MQLLQTNLENVQYLIIDEYSFVGHSLLGWIDSCCRQATVRTDTTFGGISGILVGDIAQLPPVGEKPLYHSLPKREVSLRTPHLVPGKCPYILCKNNLYNTDPL